MSGAEAIAVLGVISSIIAIVDGAKQIYDAASSTAGLPEAFGEVSKRLPTVRDILQSAEQHIRNDHPDEASCSDVLPLVTNCKERAEKLDAIFQEVIPAEDASRFKRYIGAVKSLGKRERVETLMKGLMDDVLLLQSKHGFELATAQQVEELKIAINDLSVIEPSIPDAALEDPAFTNNNFGNGPMTNNNVIGTQNSQSAYGSGDLYQAGTQNFQTRNGPVNQQTFNAPVQQYFSSRVSLPDDEVQRICDDGILRQLEFHDMQERFYDISEAHQSTFKWIYEKPTLEFLQWLQGGSGIYWITGKAGSGKSTLMKFIYQNNRTRQYLPTGVENALVSGFFFHERGQNPLLKSQEGLLRAILHSILSKYQQLIPIALPERYERLKRDVRSKQPLPTITTWSTNELRAGLKAVVCQSQMRLHLCLLIDGLDEFCGDRDDLINILNDLLPTAADSRVQVQMCLSSRPKAVFEESYSHHRHLRVQDLTEDDMKLYVRTKFNNMTRGGEFPGEDQNTTNLIIDEILHKADGVFLWVTLVVKSLIEGLRNCDNMETLRKRLSALPSGLEPLYTTMINQIEPIYHSAAGKIFNMVRVAARPLSPLAMSFSDDEPKEALSNGYVLSDDQKELRESGVEKQLKARTAGLVEVSTVKRDHRPGRGAHTSESYVQGVTNLITKQQKVQYLHLTVKEFLLYGDVPRWLANRMSISAEGDTHLRIAACCLRQLQATQSLDLYGHGAPIPDHPGIMDYFETTTEGIIFMIMFHMRQAERVTNTSSFLYLTSLDAILTKDRLLRDGRIRNGITEQGERHWTSLRYNDWQEPDEWQSDYISFLITIGMHYAVIDAFDRGYRPSQKPGRPLLLYAICYMAPKYATGDLENDGPEPAIIEELLKRKCDPNQMIPHSLVLLVPHGFCDWRARTVWEALMSHLARHFDPEWGQTYQNRLAHVQSLSNKALDYSKLQWLWAIDLFLVYGANPAQLIIQYRRINPKWSREMQATHRLSALSLFNQVFANFDDSLVGFVRNSMIAKGAIAFSQDIPVETAEQYANGVPDEWVRSPVDNLSDYKQGISTKLRLKFFFKRALARRQNKRREAEGQRSLTVRQYR